MQPAVYTYSEPDKQRVAYRGYVKVYKGQRVETISCEEVRRTKARALEDAKKKILELKKHP